MDKLSKKLKNQFRSMKERVQSMVNANKDNTDFVNHGFILWTETRQQWVGNRPRNKATRVGNRPRNKATKLVHPVLRWNTSYYEYFLETERPFPRPIPLREIIEFLQNLWKEEYLEGLYGKAELAYA